MPEGAVLAVLSPAKKLDLTSPLPKGLTPTRPALLGEMGRLLPIVRDLSVEQVAALMSISPDLATSTWERFQSLEASGDQGRPAILSFAGDVYQGLGAKSLSVADLQWAQTHLGTLSGLYGWLRPLDRMLPYRLEMGSSLRNPRGKDLYAFWRPVLAPLLDEAVAGHADPLVLNLASDEYFSAVDTRRLRARVVTLAFQDVKNGQAKSLFLFVKRARGSAARHLVTHRIERSEDLKEAAIDGYRYDAAASSPDRWVYRRPHPNP